MWKVGVLMAVCLFSLTAGESLSNTLLKKVLHKRQSSGQGMCDTADPCMNGDCVENEGNIECMCYFPYSGVNCDEVCPFDQCWETFWNDLGGSMQGGDSDEFESHESDESEESNGGSCAGPMRRVMTKSPGHLRRALEMKKRSALLSKRGKGGGKGGENSYERTCRKEIKTLLGCLDESLANEDYCTSCSNDSVVWIADVIERRDAIPDEYCSQDWECKHPGTAKCVEQVNKMFEIHYGTDATIEANPTDFQDHLDEVEECLTMIVNDELPLHGCIHNTWLKNELLLFLVEIIRYEAKGCNLTQVGMNCGVMEMTEDLDMICSLTEEERAALFDTAMECGRQETEALGSVCDDAMDKLAGAKPHLIDESNKECARLATVDATLLACNTAKRTSKLERLLNALDKKKNEEVLLNILMRTLAKNL